MMFETFTTRDRRWSALGLAVVIALCATVNHMDAAVVGPLIWEAPGPVMEREGTVIHPKERDRAELVNPTPLSDDLYRAVLGACETYDVPPSLALGVMEVESGFQVDAVGVDGRDYGLYQIRGSNHAWLSEATGADPMTPVGNIDCGVYMISYLLGRYEDTAAALTAYRWGSDNGGRSYAEAVMEAGEKWR